MIEKYHKNCDGKIELIMLTVYPPIHQERCQKCGKVISQYQEKIIKEIV